MSWLLFNVPLKREKQLQVNSESIWKQDFRSVFDVLKKKKKKVKRIQIKKDPWLQAAKQLDLFKTICFSSFLFFFIYIYDFASLLESDAVALWYWKE